MRQRGGICLKLAAALAVIGIIVIASGATVVHAAWFNESLTLKIKADVTGSAHHSNGFPVLVNDSGLFGGQEIWALLHNISTSFYIYFNSSDSDVNIVNITENERLPTCVDLGGTENSTCASAWKNMSFRFTGEVTKDGWYGTTSSAVVAAAGVTRNNDAPVTNASGRIGRGAWFDGGDILEINNSDLPDLAARQQYAFSFWFNSHTSAYGEIFTKADGGRGWTIEKRANNSIQVSAGGASGKIISDAITNNQWYFVVYQYDNTTGTDNYTLFLGDDNAGTLSMVNSVANLVLEHRTHTLSIGGSSDTGGAGCWNCIANADYDETRLWEEAHTLEFWKDQFDNQRGAGGITTLGAEQQDSDTTAPVLTVQVPVPFNETLRQDWLYINITSNEALSNASANVSGTQYWLNNISSGTAWEFNITGLAAGNHTFNITGTDLANNNATTQTFWVELNASLTAKVINATKVQRDEITVSPKIAKDTEGYLWVVGRNEDSGFVLYNSTNNGTTWTRVGQVDVSPNSDFFVAVNDSFVIAITDRPSSTDSIAGRVFSKNTNALSGNFDLSTATSQTFLAGTVTSTGAVKFLATRPLSGHTRIFHVNYTADKVQTYAAHTIIDTTTSDATLFADGNDVLHAVLETSYAGDANNRLVYFNSTDNGETWNHVSNVTDASEDVTNPKLIAHQNGISVCYSTDSVRDTVMHALSTDGGATWAATTVTDNSTEDARSCDIAERDSGSLILTYTDYTQNESFVRQSLNGTFWDKKAEINDGEEPSAVNLRFSAHTANTLSTSADYVFTGRRGYMFDSFDPPPIVTFLEPTPHNVTRPGITTIEINISSDEPLTNASVNISGTQYFLVSISADDTVWFLNVTDPSLGTNHTFNVTANDTANNNYTTESRWVQLNSVPTVDSVWAEVVSAGDGSEDWRIRVDAADGDGVGDLDTCFFEEDSARSKSFTSDGICTIDIPGINPNGLVWVNDSRNSNVSFSINAAIIDSGVYQNASGTNSEATQTYTRQLNLSNSGSLPINATINLTALAGSSATSFGGSFDKMLIAASGSNSTVTQWTGDWVTTNSLSWQHRSGTNTHSTQSFNATAPWSGAANLPNATEFSFTLPAASVGDGDCASSTYTTASTGTMTGLTASGEVTHAVNATADCVDEGAASEIETSFQNQTASSTFSSVALINQTNRTFVELGGLALTSIDLSSVCWNNGTQSFAAGGSVNVFNCTWDDDTADHLVEAVGGEEQDTDQTSEAGVNAYTELTFNLTYSKSVALTDVAIGQRCRSDWGQNYSTINLSAGEDVSAFPLGCNSTSAITKSRAQFNISAGGNVTVWINASGFLEVQATNTDTNVNYTSVLVNGTSLLPDNWTLNGQAREFTVGALNNGVANLTNLTITSTVEFARERATSVPDCSGFTVFANYCFAQEAVDQGGGQTLTTYTYRSFVNVTHSEAPHRQVWYFPTLTRFTNWASRNADSETFKVDSNSSNLSISDDGTVMTLLIDTSHSTSSLSVGDHTVEITYTRTTQAGSSPSGPTGGGGGGGGTTIIEVPLEHNLTLFIKPTRRQFLLEPGAEDKWTFILQNPNSTAQTIEVFFEQGRENDESFQWGLFQVGALVFSDLVIEVPAGTPQSPGEATVDILVRTPITADTGSHKFNLVASGENTPRTIAVVGVIVGGSSFTKGGFEFFGVIADAIGAFLAWTIQLNVPVFGIDSIRVLYVVLGAAGIGVAVMFFSTVRWFHRKGSRA